MALVKTFYSRDASGNTTGFSFEYDGSAPGATTGKLTVSTWSDYHGGEAGVPMSDADHSTEYILKDVQVLAGVFTGSVVENVPLVSVGVPTLTKVSVTPSAPNMSPGIMFKYSAMWPFGKNAFYALSLADLNALVVTIHTAGWPAS